MQTCVQKHKKKFLMRHNKLDMPKRKREDLERKHAQQLRELQEAQERERKMYEDAVAEEEPLLPIYQPQPFVQYDYEDPNLTQQERQRLYDQYLQDAEAQQYEQQINQQALQPIDAYQTIYPDNFYEVGQQEETDQWTRFRPRVNYMARTVSIVYDWHDPVTTTWEEFHRNQHNALSDAMRSMLQELPEIINNLEGFVLTNKSKCRLSIRGDNGKWWSTLASEEWRDMRNPSTAMDKLATDDNHYGHLEFTGREFKFEFVCKPPDYTLMEVGCAMTDEQKKDYLKHGQGDINKFYKEHNKLVYRIETAGDLCFGITAAVHVRRAEWKRDTADLERKIKESKDRNEIKALEEKKEKLRQQWTNWARKDREPLRIAKAKEILRESGVPEDRKVNMFDAQRVANFLNCRFVFVPIEQLSKKNPTIKFTKVTEEMKEANYPNPIPNYYVLQTYQHCEPIFNLGPLIHAKCKFCFECGHTYDRQTTHKCVNKCNLCFSTE